MLALRWLSRYPDRSHSDFSGLIQFINRPAFQDIFCTNLKLNDK